jgi:hypothetical protein
MPKIKDVEHLIKKKESRFQGIAKRILRRGPEISNHQSMITSCHKNAPGPGYAAQSLSFGYLVRKRLQRQSISLSTEAGDLPGNNTRHKGSMAKFLALVDIGKMNLDNRYV